MENIDNQFVEKMNVRILDNLMNQSEYTPYCGVFFCKNQTKFNGTQFVCLKCGYITQFPKEIINEYKKKWGKF